MTDKEIEKALKCCSGGTCRKCPYYLTPAANCIVQLEKDALDYIQRLKAQNQQMHQNFAHLYETKRSLEDELIERGFAEYAYGDFRILSDEEKDKIRKDTAENFAETLIALLFEENKGETITIKDLHTVIKDVAKAQYGVEIDDKGEKQ